MMTASCARLLVAACFVALLPGCLGVQAAASGWKQHKKSEFGIEAGGAVNVLKGGRRAGKGGEPVPTQTSTPQPSTEQPSSVAPSSTPTAAPATSTAGPTTTFAPGSVNADYGGNAHKDTGKIWGTEGARLDHNGLPEVWRPEAVKSERCDGSACHKCTHKTDDGCWHGGNQGGDMVIAVQANSLFESFAQEVFFKCSNGDNGGGTFQMRVWEIINGNINLYVNHNLVTEILGPISPQAPKDFPITFETATARVRAVFVPIDRNSPSSVKGKLEVIALSPTADKCMTGKMCMAALGDGTDAGFELRNDNAVQHKCLESGSSSLPNHLQAKCLEWDACLPPETKLNLKTLLKASGVGSASLADQVSTGGGNLTVSADPNICINPAIDDPESWDCECLEDMLITCGGADEACFHRIMCNSADVCQSWKDAAQCTTGDLNAALGQRSGEHASSGIDNALDSSLTGKCSQ